MNYRILGRTGLKVSVLGFGCMRLPLKGDRVDDEKAIPLLRRAVELGVNYFDSAVFYCNDDSQRAMGDALHDLRDKIILSTKNNYYADAGGWWRNLENSLRLMRTDFIDVYHFHGLSWDRYTKQVCVKGGLWEAVQKAFDQKLIRHIAYSCHDTAENNIKLAEEGIFESALMQYNLLDRKNEPAINRLHELGMGVAIMGPVAGGRLAGLPDSAQPSATSALKWVMSNPSVSIALSGMTTIEMLEENVAAASEDVSMTSDEADRAASVGAAHEKIMEMYCTACGYCMPCPTGVSIPENFTLAHLDQAYGMTDLAKGNYAKMRGQARYCLECGKCMPKCPQNLPIPTHMRTIVERLDADLGKTAIEAYVAKMQPEDGGVRFDFSVAATNLSKESVQGRVMLDFAGDVALDEALALKPMKHKRINVAYLAKPAAILGPVRYRAVLEGGAGVPDVQGDYPLVFAHRFTSEAKYIADQLYVCGPRRVVAGSAGLCPTHRFGFRVGHDGTDFILLADVEDDQLHPEDGIEIFFDCRKPGEMRSGPYGPGCGYARILPAPEPRVESKYAIGVDFSGSRVRAMTRKGSYSLKARIPLAGLNIPEGQRLIAFDIHQVSHDRDGKVDIHLAWQGNERTRRFTFGMGLLYLE